jgi:hypothetical protein
MSRAAQVSASPIRAEKREEGISLSICLGRGVVEVCPSRLNISYTIGGTCQGVKHKENLKKLAGA